MKRYRDLVKYLPLILVRNTRQYIDTLGCWYFDSRKHEAPLKPYRIFLVHPDQICRCPIESPSTTPLRPSPVIGGGWDKNLRKFSEDVVFRSFDSRFNEGAKWENTDYYDFMVEWIDNNGSYKGIKNRSKLVERCRQLDNLYQHIKQHGYLSQQDLNDQKVSALDTEFHLPPERKEITVNVTREGEFVWSGGAHRLSIVKLLGLDSIPVRIKIRHKQWQRLRDQVYLGRGEVPEGLENHPDLRFENKDNDQINYDCE